MTVVFVPRRPHTRPYKIAKALKHLDVRTVLICEEWFYDGELFEEVFDEVHFFKRDFPWSGNKYAKIIEDRIYSGFGRMEELVKEVDPDLIHAFCEPYDHIVRLIERTSYPVVMSDGADFSGISSGIGSLDQRTRENEKYCFENVDGICHKGPPYELEFYREEGYQVDCPEIRWFDHCDEELFVDPGEVTKESEKDGAIHIVYTGLVSDAPTKKYINYISLAYALAQQGVHLHIYSNPHQRGTEKRYKELEEELEHFHFHDPLPYKEISKEIARYDWGLWWHEPTGGDRIRPSKQKVAIGNKMFSYLEAGLPIIVGAHNGGGRPIIEEKGIGLSMTKEDIPVLKEKLEGVDKKAMDQRVREARSEFSLSANAERLVNFYKEVLQDGREIGRTEQ